MPASYTPASTYHSICALQQLLTETVQLLTQQPGFCYQPQIKKNQVTALHFQDLQMTNVLDAWFSSIKSPWTDMLWNQNTKRIKQT